MQRLSTTILFMMGILVMGASFVGAAPPKAQHKAPAGVSYQKQIVPILRASCVGCHGDKNPSSGFKATSYADVMKGGAKGVDIIPGHSDKSRLYSYLTGALKPRMPIGGALKPDQIALFKRWIDAGAKGDKAPAGKKKTARRSDDEMPRIAAPTPVTALIYTPDGKVLASGCYQQVQLWDAATGKRTVVWKGHIGAVRTLAVSKDGRTLAAGGGEAGVSGEVRLWDLTQGREVRALSGHTDLINALAFSPDGKRLVTGSADKTLRVWDLTTGAVLATLADHSDAVNGVAYSPDGKYFASCSGDRNIKVWDAAVNKRLYTIEAHDDGVTGVQFSPDGKSLLSSSLDASARIWTFGTDNSPLAVTLNGHERAVLAAAYSPDGQTIATASADRSVKVWTTAGANTATLTGSADWIYALRFSPDGKRIAAGTWDGRILFWTVADGKPAGLPLETASK